MRIRTQFIICLVAFSVILVIIAGSVATTELQVDQLSAQEQISSNIERGASSLNSVSIDYFLYQEDLQFSRWQSALSSLSTDMSNLKVTSPQQQTLANNVAGDLQRLNALFDDVVSYLQSVPRNVSVRIDPAFQLRWSSMAVQSQALAFDASQLSRSLNNQAHQANDTNIFLTFSFVGAFGAFLATIYLMVFRRTLKSVTDLQKGIDTIGSGNLDYKIETEGQNEITELSDAFNQMTTNLKTVTASKTELEAEIVGRKQAEIALRVSEQRWATTLGSIGDAVIAADLSGKITFVNGVAERLTGWTMSEVLRSPVTEVFNIINEQTRKEAENPVCRVLEKGVVVGLANHTVLIRKDGTEVAIDDSGAPIKDKDGNITGVVLVFRDITERRQIEQALRESEVKFRTVADFTYDWEYWIAPDGNMVYVSPSCERVTGYKAEEFINDPQLLTKIVHPEDKSAVGSHFDLISSRELHDVDFRIVTRNGETLWLSHACRAVFDGNGKWIGRRASNRDITERKQMEAKLEDYTKNLEKIIKERTKRLELASIYARSLIEASLDPLVTINIEGKITDVNKATETATGCSKEELIGSDFSDYFTEPEKAKIGYKRVFTDGFVIDYPLAIRHKSGKITDVLYNASIYRNEEGEVQGIFAAARDITQRKNLEKQLKDSERLATIGATAGMVGHDIRNPLQAITSDVYLAKTDLAPMPESEEKKNIQESLTEIEKNITYINKIVADLQDFARPLSPKLEEIDLEKTVHFVLSQLNIPGNVTVKHSIHKDFPKLTTDESYIQRILINLSNNAIQAMPKGGKLTINAAIKKGKAVITVQDNGEGIPENVRDKLFMPLVTTKSKGQGFGLAVVKRFTEGLDGTVTFESEVGKGTKFIIELPI